MPEIVMAKQNINKILISACLVGNKVRYNAADVPCENDWLEQWKAEGRIVAFCPEVAGGLPVPRPPAEIAGENGGAVLEGKGKVLDNKGEDVTVYFVDGAKKALETAQKNEIKVAILKENSPSCGSSFIYDGTFSGNRLEGQGVTTALLQQHGIRVFSENEIAAAAVYINELEGNP
jgi:uncharacterized protein YbbK (DUF523 family)